MKRMLHIVLGTKGQYVKMAPVIKELDKRRSKYNLVHTRQHTTITEQISEVFRIRPPDYFLDNRRDDIVNIRQVFFWYLKCILKSVIYRKQLWKNRGGICLIHGDTPSTLLGLIIAKINGLEVAHIEAGLRSYSIFHPFPEEIIRVITTKFSDYLFTSSKWAYKNLKQENVKGKIFNTKSNTVFDAIEYALESDFEVDIPKSKFVVAAIHRNETLYVKDRFAFSISIIEKIAKKWKVIFVVHKPTMFRLKKNGLFNKINQNKNIIIKPYYEYFSFMSLIKKAIFVVTDGGSLQEETYYLNIPCLILRKKTERQYGLDSTSYLSNFDVSKIDYFLENYEKFRRKTNLLNSSPSKSIVDILSKEL